MTDDADLVRAALAHYDLGAYRVDRLAESYNVVYRVVAPNGAYVLRIGPGISVHAPGAVSAEAAWTAQLGDRGLRVPRLVRAGDGAPSVHVGRGRGHECSLWTWVPGRPLTRPVSGADLHRLAALGARLHEASAPLPDAPPGALTASSVCWFAVPDALDTLGRPHRAVLLAARDRAQVAVDRLWQDADVPPRLVHGDLTPANVVEHAGNLFAIDFQDLAWGHVEQDLAHSLHGVTGGADPAEGLAAFRTGYERVRPWPVRLDVALLTDLVAARRVALVNLAVLRGRPDLERYVARHAAALIASAG